MHDIDGLLNTEELRDIKEHVLALADYIKKTVSMRVLVLGETTPEIDHLLHIVAELYQCKVALKLQEDLNKEKSEEKEREIFKKYFNQIIDNLLDGNTKGKYS
mgnify:CR=1 FL=1